MKVVVGRYYTPVLDIYYTRPDVCGSLWEFNKLQTQTKKTGVLWQPYHASPPTSRSNSASTVSSTNPSSCGGAAASWPRVASTSSSRAASSASTAVRLARLAEAKSLSSSHFMLATFLRTPGRGQGTQ